MPKKLDTILIEAIRDAVIRIGSQSEFANQTGVSQGTIAKYLSGSVTKISDSIFSKMEPFLDLPEENLNNSPMDFKSKLTRVMVDIFEELSKDGQNKILDIAEDELNKESIEIIELSADEREELEKRGIEIIDNVYGDFEVAISLLGLSWIYNLIHDAYFQRDYTICCQETKPNFFRNLLEFEKDYNAKQSRNLMISYSKVEAYEDNKYTVRSIYLEGTPPRMFSSHLIQQDSDIMKDQGFPFELWDQSIIKLKLSEKEAKALSTGETLKINCKQIFE